MMLVVPENHARNKALLLADIRKFMAERYAGDCNEEQSFIVDVIIVSPSKCYVHVSIPKPRFHPDLGRLEYVHEVHHERYDLVPGKGGVGFA